ncbi:regulator of G protein signaling domain-containing protein [Dactylonectria macrodidyma]|uniref:Regulator of G protein signaling domain-containing protein n=1 Tax=Dactylonectria macrodidyma TaxID=307937 RepID=A0A9P9IUE7_9HYPO|nr:regulator of G protein signaling domain-containing protein [Dactylonectria macrodidyma]
MVIKPKSPPAPARNSGRHKPSEASPTRTIEKRHSTQLNAAFTELRNSIPSMRVVMAKEGEENATKDPQEGTPKTRVDKVPSRPFSGPFQRLQRSPSSTGTPCYTTRPSTRDLPGVPAGFALPARLSACPPAWCFLPLHSPLTPKKPPSSNPLMAFPFPLDGHCLSHHPQPTVHHAVPPSNTLEQPPTHSRSSLSERSHVAAAAAIPAPSPRLDQRSSSAILALAMAALDRTQSAIATISEPVIRPRHSNGTLETLPPPQLDTRLGALQLGQEPPAQECLEPVPCCPPHSATEPNRPPPAKSTVTANKMHQTSSRLLRMTDDNQPFTRDFEDLFSTLVVSLLPLSAHRVRLTKIEYTFLSEDAINNLGSLKFSQSNRIPDPKDPSRIVTTTTTTTFSMGKDMARSICQRFVEARFIESADGKYQQVYNMKGSVWQLTPKGITVLDRFCSRSGIQQKQVSELVNLGATQLVLLERDSQSDKLLHDQGTLEVILRRFVGAEHRNIKPTVNAADSDSLHDYKDGLTGVKVAAERKVNGKTYRDTFTGKATADWLMDCSTMIDKRETVEVATLFVEYDLMEPVAQDRAYMSQNPGCNLFQPTKYAIYQISQRGKDLINGSGWRGRESESEGGAASQRNSIIRDSNTQRLDKILNDPALRLLFRENLRDTHCEENLSFYQDVDEFVRNCKAVTRTAQKNPNNTSMDGVKEIMAQAYGIYNAFLAPVSPRELNIDHQLRNSLATRMTKAVGQDVAMIDTLQGITSLFEDTQNAVVELMASDSVPKFLSSPKYEQQLRNYELDLVGRGPESQAKLYP